MEHRHDASGQIVRREGCEFLEWGGCADLEFARDGAAQAGQMRATTKRLAKVMRECSDVGAFCAGDLEPGKRRLVLGDLKIIDVNEAFSAFDFDAFAGEFVKWGAVNLYGADHRRQLQLVA